jgi:hypothetical protein
VPLTLLGLAIWGLVIVSTLPAVRWNEVALVLVPFDLLLLFLPEPARRFYAQLRFGMLAAIALLVAVGVLRQDLHSILFIPLPVMLAVAFLPLRTRRRPTTTSTTTTTTTKDGAPALATDPLSPSDSSHSPHSP